MTTYPKSGDLQRGLASNLTANPGGKKFTHQMLVIRDLNSNEYWSHKTGWGNLARATKVFTVDEEFRKPTKAERIGRKVEWETVDVEQDDNDFGFTDPFVKHPANRKKPETNPSGDPMNEEGMTWLEWARAAHIPAPLTPTLHRAAHRDWEQGVDPTEWRAHIERHGYPHVNPARSNPPVRSIHDGMERALWVCAFADWVEEQGPSARRKYGAHNGAKWHDVAPDAPDEAADAGKELAEMFRRANGKDLLMLLGLAAKADGVKATDTYAESFGHYMAMQALGHGVSWFDDHAQFPITFPRFECHCPDGMSLEWSPRKLATQNPGPKEWHPPPGATVEFTVYEIDDTASSGPRRAFVGKYVDLKSAKAEAKRYAGGYPREVVDIRGKVVYRDDAQARRGRR